MIHTQFPVGVETFLTHYDCKVNCKVIKMMTPLSAQIIRNRLSAVSTIDLASSIPINYFQLGSCLLWKTPTKEPM